MYCGLFSSQVYEDYFDKEIKKLPTIRVLKDNDAESLFYMLRFESGIDVYFTKPLGYVEDMLETDVVYSVFVEDDLAINGIANQYTFLHHLGNALS